MRLSMITLAMFAALTLSAVAADLTTAKTNGQLGEQVDGYLGLVDPTAPEDVKALMAEINAKRLAKYTEIAASRGVSVEAVAKITAEKVFQLAEPGTYLFDQTNSWKQK